MSKTRNEKSQKTNPVRKQELIDQVFNLLDINKDGTVSVSELEKASRCLGMNPTKKEAEKMISDCKPKRSGFLSKNEFKNFFENHRVDLETEMRELKAAFRVLDKDNSGTINGQELRDVMMKYGNEMGESEIRELISLVDKNGDGLLDIEEFAFALCELKEMEYEEGNGEEAFYMGDRD